MTMRFENLYDYIKIECKKCCSNDIDLSIDECDTCGDTIKSFCNNCKAEYIHHDFKIKQIIGIT